MKIIELVSKVPFINVLFRNFETQKNEMHGYKKNSKAYQSGTAYLMQGVDLSDIRNFAVTWITKLKTLVNFRKR